MEQQDWDDAPTDRWAWAWCNRAQQRPPNLADAARAETSQGSSDQPRTGSIRHGTSLVEQQHSAIIARQCSAV